MIVEAAVRQRLTLKANRVQRASSIRKRMRVPASFSRKHVGRTGTDLDLDVAARVLGGVEFRLVKLQRRAVEREEAWFPRLRHESRRKGAVLGQVAANAHALVLLGIDLRQKTL